MVCLQNGLCEERVAAIAGAERTVGAVVAWGAAMPEPGVYDRTAPGGFALGRIDGAVDARLEELGRVLECVGPTELTRNLAGKRWSKLAINCAISSLGTLGGDRLGALLQHRFVRRLALEIMTEAVHVARREASRLEKVSGTLDLDWIALTEEERRAAAPLRCSPSTRCSTRSACATGGCAAPCSPPSSAAVRPPSTSSTARSSSAAAGARVPTPVNARVRAWVWDVAGGKRTPGMALLRELGSASSS